MANQTSTRRGQTQANTNGSGRTLMIKTHNDMPLEVRQNMVELCNQQLADLFDMKSIAKQAHWNVRGRHFFELHKLFDELSEVLEEHIDTVAERCTALGGIARGTVRMAAESSRLAPYPDNLIQDVDHVKAVAERLATLCASTRRAADLAEENRDMGSNDMFIEVVRDLDKYLWFVEAHIQAG